MTEGDDNIDRILSPYNQRICLVRMTKIISGQARNDTRKDNFGREITSWRQLNREAHAARRQLRSSTDESAGWSSGRHARETPDPASRPHPTLRKSDASPSWNPFAVARGSPARNMQYVLIRGKEIAAVSTAVTAINREKGILDACARARKCCARV